MERSAPGSTNSRYKGPVVGKPSVIEEQRGTVQLESSRKEELSIKRPWRARQTEVRPPGLGVWEGVCVQVRG